LHQYLQSRLVYPAAWLSTQRHKERTRPQKTSTEVEGQASAVVGWTHTRPQRLALMMIAPQMLSPLKPLLQRTNPSILHFPCGLLRSLR
jgi:hypothetical protein